MGILIELADQDYQYCKDYASGKTNIFALNNTSRVIKAVANGTRYENRLKAEKVAMLEELQKEINELCINNPLAEDEEDMNRGIEKAVDVIQQKINELKGERNADNK